MDFVHKVIKIEPLKSKLKSFGCEVIEIDGHSAKKIIKVLNTKKYENLSIDYFLDCFIIR